MLISFFSMLNPFYANQHTFIYVCNVIVDTIIIFVENLVAIMKFSYFYGILHTRIFVNSLKIQYVKGKNFVACNLY